MFLIGICETSFSVSRPRLGSLGLTRGLRLRDRYRDSKILMSKDETDTKTSDTQSQASRLRLKRGLKAKIETNTEKKEEKLSH